MGGGQASQAQHFQHQRDDLHVRLDAGVAVELGTELRRIAGLQRPFGPCLQHGSEVAQPHRAVAPQLVGIDPCGLGGDIGTHPHQPAAELIRQLEGLEVEIAGCAGEQRIEELDDRRAHQLVTPAVETVQHPPAQALQRPGLRRQHLVDAVREYPEIVPGELGLGHG